MEILLQLVVIFIAGLGFAVFFNVHGYRVVLNSLGAVAAWGLYLAASHAGGDVFWSYFGVTTLIALVCEALARVTKTPTSLMTVPMIVPPLIPGSDLYNTFFNLMKTDMEAFAFYGIRLVLEIAAINFGILVAASLVKVLQYFVLSRVSRGKA